MKKICFWIVCTFFFSAGFVIADDGAITVTDMVGRQVAVPFDPGRIVCIGPGALRLIVYLQAESRVVGVEEMEGLNPRGRPYWLAHSELWSLPHCGPGGPVSINKKPDLEAVLSVAPQVIFITYMQAPLAEEVQQTLGIPVVVLSYGGFATFDETIYDSLRLAARILNRSNRSDAVIGYMESLRTDLSERTRDIPKSRKPTVYVGGIGYRGAHGIGSTEQRYVPFQWVHTDSVVESLKPSAGTHIFVDKEMLLKLNPDVIFIDGGGLTLVALDYRKNPAYYRALKAFSSRSVYTLHPFNWYVTNLGTALADAFAVGKILYAERFRDVNPEQMADSIYTYLVGKPVYRDMEKDYGPLGCKAPFFHE